MKSKSTNKDGVRVTFHAEEMWEAEEAIERYLEGKKAIRVLSELDEKLRQIYKYAPEDQLFQYHDEMIKLDTKTICYVRMLIGQLESEEKE
jgi:hypothetical protein